MVNPLNIFGGTGDVTRRTRSHSESSEEPEPNMQPIVSSDDELVVVGDTVNRPSHRQLRQSERGVEAVDESEIREEGQPRRQGQGQTFNMNLSLQDASAFGHFVETDEQNVDVPTPARIVRGGDHVDSPASQERRLSNIDREEQHLEQKQRDRQQRARSRSDDAADSRHREQDIPPPRSRQNIRPQTQTQRNDHLFDDITAPQLDKAVMMAIESSRTHDMVKKLFWLSVVMLALTSAFLFRLTFFTPYRSSTYQEEGHVLVYYRQHYDEVMEGFQAMFLILIVLNIAFRNDFPFNLSILMLTFLFTGVIFGTVMQRNAYTELDDDFACVDDEST